LLFSIWGEWRWTAFTPGLRESTQFPTDRKP
jgi:hypothetical protein